MATGYRFPYTSVERNPDALMPRLSLTLRLRERSVEVTGLVDSGSPVNVIPYSVGVALGAVWEHQQVEVPLAGSLGNIEGRALIVQAMHPQLTPEHPVELIFAWTRDENVPILFGQTNFLMEFRVCFDASLAVFEVFPRAH